MSLIKDFFGKKATDITEADLINYFLEKRVENDSIEYKSWTDRSGNDPKLKEDAILKTICGMLNSGGGLIMWGSPKKIKDGEEEYIQGPLVPIEKNYEKDSFIAKIVERIIPAPQNVRFHKVELDEKGKNVILFRVKESKYKPHQFDGIYYMRLDGQTRKAPHHYIEALMKQIKFPNLESHLKINSLSWKSEYSFDSGRRQETGDHIAILSISILILNMSSLENEEDVVYKMSVDRGIIIGAHPTAHAYRYANSQRTYKIDKPTTILSFGQPLLENVNIQIHQSEALRHNGVINFNIQFGGKKSPVKRSHYTLNINSFDAEIPENCIVDSTVNKLTIDLMAEREISKSQMVESFFKQLAT